MNSRPPLPSTEIHKSQCHVTSNFVSLTTNKLDSNPKAVAFKPVMSKLGQVTKEDLKQPSLSSRIHLYKSNYAIVILIYVLSPTSLCLSQRWVPHCIQMKDRKNKLKAGTVRIKECSKRDARTEFYRILTPELNVKKVIFA